MALVAATCTQCGAALEVDPEKDAAICPFCHTPFITEKAINNYNTTNITNIDTINAEVVNIESSDSASNLSHSAEALVNFGEWDKAQGIYTKITEMYPFDWKGWYGLLQTKTHNFQIYFDQYDEYTFLAETYEKLKTLSNQATPNMTLIKEYLDVTYEKIKSDGFNKISAIYAQEQQYLQERIPAITKQVQKNIPLEIKDEKLFGSRVIKVIWIAWVALAAIISLAHGIMSVVSGYELDIEFGFVCFANMDSFWDVTLFASIMMLIIQVVLSFCLSIIGILGLAIQRHSKQKKLNIFKCFTKGSIIAFLLHIVFWLIAICIVGINDPGYFLVYTGSYRDVETILFHSQATETGACWIALLLIIIYSIINYVLIAAPLFATERIGNKKRKAIQQNIKYNQELLQLMERKENLPVWRDNELLRLKMLEKKHS